MSGSRTRMSASDQSATVSSQGDFVSKLAVEADSERPVVATCNSMPPEECDKNKADVVVSNLAVPMDITGSTGISLSPRSGEQRSKSLESITPMAGHGAGSGGRATATDGRDRAAASQPSSACDQSGKHRVSKKRRRHGGKKCSMPAEMHGKDGGIASLKDDKNKTLGNNHVGHRNGNRNRESSSLRKESKRRRHRAKYAMRSPVRNRATDVASPKRQANHCKMTVVGSNVSYTHGSRGSESNTRKRRRGSHTGLSVPVGSRRAGSASSKDIKRSRLDSNRDSVAGSNVDRGSRRHFTWAAAKSSREAFPSARGRSLGMLSRETIRQFRQHIRNWEERLVSFGESLVEHFGFLHFKEMVKLHVSRKRKGRAKRVRIEHSPDTSTALLNASLPDVISLIATAKASARNLASKLVAFQVSMSKADAFVDVR